MIVEGYGDAEAVPSLVAKTAIKFGTTAIAANPIRAGEWKSLKQVGSFERYLDLALTRRCDLILVVLDLEDDCPVAEAAIANERILSWKGGRDIRVELVFLAREYETLFLYETSCLPVVSDFDIPDDPMSVRGAKERIKSITGKRYKETQDQLRFTKELDLDALYAVCRSYKRFCKALIGLEYNQLEGF